MSAQVIPIRKPVAVSPRHPSLHGAMPRPSIPVTLTRRQAELIASLIDHARRAPIDDKGADAAIQLLMGGKS